MSTKKSYWLTAGAYSIGNRVSLLVFGFGSFYLLVRKLPQEEFGAWALFMTITTIIEVSRNGLIQNALIKLLHSYAGENSHKIVTGSWAMNLLYSILLLILLVAFSTAISTFFNVIAYQGMFLCYAITLLLLVPFSQFNYLQQYRFSFSGIFWSNFTRQGIFFLVILGYYLFEFDFTLLSLVLYQAGSVAIGLIVAYFCARKYLIYNWVFEKEYFLKVFNFGKFVMGTNLLSLLYKSTDQLFVGYYLNTSSLALYNTSIRLSNLIEYPATSVTEVVYPKSAENFEKDGDASSKYFFEKAAGLTMTITLPTIILTFLLADPIIYFVAGEQYAYSATILRITILFGLFTPFSRQFGTAMDSSGRPHLNFLVLCASVIINILANFIGINYYGILGAAFGTLVSYGIVGFIIYILMKRIFRVQFVNIFKYMFEYYALGYFKIINIRKTGLRNFFS